MMKQRGRKGIKRMLLSLGLCMLLAGETGCGQNGEVLLEEEVVLIDPPAAGISSETVIRRNLTNADIYDASVCPEARLYGLDISASFEAYDVYPGQEIFAGRTLMHGNTDSIDSRMEKLEESIAESEESYQEYIQENTPKYQELLQKIENYSEAMEELEQKKEMGWEAVFQVYEKEQTLLRQQEIELGQEMKERGELYELDHAWQLKQMEYLKSDRQKMVLSAGMKGVAADVLFLSPGDRVAEGKNLVAVADTSVKELKCDYIPANEIMRAEEVYAIVKGKRREVEYVAMSATEYDRTKKQNGKVYSTFQFLDDSEEIDFGDAAVIVVVKERVEDVTAVPTEAIRKDGSVNYVYVLKDNKREYTAIKTGIQSGRYTEVISGLEEGDKVMTDSTIEGGGAYVIQKGNAGIPVEETGTLFYPFAEWVNNPVEHGTVYLEKILVQQNQSVKKGEVLAKVWVEGDETGLIQSRKKLQREEERLADLRASENADEKSIETKEESVARLREEIQALEHDYAVTEIRATVSGVVTSIAKYKEGDTIANGASLVLLSNESRSCISVSDKGSRFSFGQEVEVSYTDSQGITQIVPGKVLTLPPLSGETLMDKTALIGVSDEAMKQMKGSTQVGGGRWQTVSYKVSATYKHMEQVLLVPKDSVAVIEGQTYVKMKMEDGEVIYLEFLAGGFDLSNYWVIDGLTEGMEICSE